MNKNLAINNAYIDGKPYLYFGKKVFNKYDVRIHDVAKDLKWDGYEVIFVYKKKTTFMHVFKELNSSGMTARKEEALDWERPKYLIKSTDKNTYQIAEISY